LDRTHPLTRLKRWVEAREYKLLLRSYLLASYLTYLPILGGLFKRWFTIYAIHQHGAKVVSREEAHLWIERAGRILSSICYCRETFKRCSVPAQMCLRISDTRLFKTIDGDGGRVRFISKEEAKGMVDEAEKMGFIHLLAWCDYPYVYAICNCCGCCCIAYRIWRRFDIDSIERGDMVAERVECSMCGRCIEMCRFGAIKTDGFDQGRCYGCGVCRGVCEDGAIRLIRR
jgi:Pyruvate/2-oxoacid:ferredoxin oxidoreductase delta subunit